MVAPIEFIVWVVDSSGQSQYVEEKIEVLLLLMLEPEDDVACAVKLVVSLLLMIMLENTVGLAAFELLIKLEIIIPPVVQTKLTELLD